MRVVPASQHCRASPAVEGSRRSPGYRFESPAAGSNACEDMGSKAFKLGWVGITKLDNSSCFSNWAEALGDHETWEQELKGEGKRGKPYGINTPGMQVSIQFYAFARNPL